MNPEKYRKDFPLLDSASNTFKAAQKNKRPLVYVDNACMSLRPRQVIDEVVKYYSEYPACGGRSKHHLAAIVEDKVDDSRKIMQKFISSKKKEEVVFTKNTTEGLNLVYNSLEFKKGDVILSTDKEHNSNLIPVQVLAKSKGIIQKRVPSISSAGPSSNGIFDIEAFKKLMQGGVA